MNDTNFFLNGVNGRTGESLNLTRSQLYDLARIESPDPVHRRELEERRERDQTFPLGYKYGVDPESLSSAGWGVIFAEQDTSQVQKLKEALKPLLDHRHSQAGDRYKEFDGQLGVAQHGDCYRGGDSKQGFLQRHGKGTGVADPDKVPYYLLIVGSPETIPYDFQYQLDVQYAVGRLYFEQSAAADGPFDCYGRYAKGVVEAETGNIQRAQKIALFGVQNPDDRPTFLSRTRLVEPLAERLKLPGWEVDAVPATLANKAYLSNLVGGNATPALLFTASHGMVFPKDDPLQMPHQGALLCGDWPGPLAWLCQGSKEIPHDYYLAGEDIPNTADLAGVIAFHFACFGAGTPHLNEYPHLAPLSPEAIASRSFVASLPQRLLGHPKGAALAVIGHVERAWGWSFAYNWQGTGDQLESFESAMKTLMDGLPVGLAMESFGSRYAELSTELSEVNKKIDRGYQPDVEDLAARWTASNDARSYVIMGDPATRLPLRRTDKKGELS
jgi:hypothetical protein